MPFTLYFCDTDRIMTYIPKSILSLLKDPGFFIALANALLFSRNSPLSFCIIMVAFCLTIGLKSCAGTLDSNHSFFRFLKNIGQKNFIGLEIMGYACLTISVIAMVHQLFIEFISSFCFGFANLLLSYRYTSNTFMAQNNWENVLTEMRKTLSLTPFVIALLHEPIILVCFGYLFAGLAAGGEALWLLPLLCVIPYITITKPHMDRAIPQGCLCLCAVFFMMIAISHRVWILVASNIFCVIAFFEITLQEHRLFLKGSTGKK